MKVSNKQIAEVFKKARPFIVSGHSRYICLAIDELRYRTYRYSHVTRAKQIIHQRLRGLPCYESWLIKHHRNLYLSVDFEMLPLKWRQGRLAWLDSLIEEFSK